MFADLLRSQHLSEILQTSLIFKTSEKVVKSGCLGKCLRWRAPTFVRNERGLSSILLKIIDVAKLLGGWYTSSTVKTSKNVVKSGCFQKILR